jgi:hypothetical protein
MSRLRRDLRWRHKEAPCVALSRGAVRSGNAPCFVSLGSIEIAIGVSNSVELPLVRMFFDR